MEAGEKSSGRKSPPRKPPRKAAAAPGRGWDPSKPRPCKAKEVRREKFRQKAEAAGMEVDAAAKNKKGGGGGGVEKGVDEWLRVGGEAEEEEAESRRHAYTTRLVPVDERKPESMENFEETFAIYQRYQVCDHIKQACGWG